MSAPRPQPHSGRKYVALLTSSRFKNEGSLTFSSCDNRACLLKTEAHTVLMSSPLPAGKCALNAKSCFYNKNLATLSTWQKLPLPGASPAPRVLCGNQGAKMCCRDSWTAVPLSQMSSRSLALPDPRVDMRVVCR